MNSVLDKLKKPLYLGITTLMVGFFLGLLWGWVIQPVEWKDASPSLLHPGYQEDYLRMSIVMYGLTGNRQEAINRWNSLGDSAQSSMNSIKLDPKSLDPILIDQFSTLMSTSAGFSTSGDQPSDTGASNFGKYALIFLAVVLILAVLYALLKFLKPSARRAVTPAQQAGEYSRQVELTDYSAMGEENPMAQFVTTYVAGDDLFDDSFSIDSASGEFLGECGVGISDTIGVGDPKKVSAFELWMFDKNDIQTVTKVLMSNHTINDPSAFQRLQSKGEPMAISIGQKISLETATLQMIATIADLEYGQGGLPDNSYFHRVTLELAVWQKVSPIG